MLANRRERWRTSDRQFNTNEDSERHSAIDVVARSERFELPTLGIEIRYHTLESLDN